jgi:cobalt-zinc-cadmium efflux system outer membrane protein
LLASQFNIDAQKAAVIQAKLWTNPYLSGELNAIDPSESKYFNVGQNGQKAFAIQQLIYLGNKKHNEVELAKSNSMIAEFEYQDLLRELRFQLRTSFFNIYYNNLAAGMLDFQINNLDTLITAYTVQSQKGNIPLRDLVRLQSLFLTFRNNRTDLLNKIVDDQQKLSLITGSDSTIFPNPSVSETEVYQRKMNFTLDSLQWMALNNRPDILLADANISGAEWNLKWQKSLVVPDITLGAAYDQHGGAFQNQVNLTLGIPLVLWNRNQGNIKIADDIFKTSQTMKDQKLLEVSTEVTSAYQRFLDARENAKLINSTTFSNLKSVYIGVLHNFEMRNISLLEFTDFMESYNESINQSYQFTNTLSNVSEEINYVTGSNIF